MISFHHSIQLYSSVGNTIYLLDFQQVIALCWLVFSLLGQGSTPTPYHHAYACVVMSGGSSGGRLRIAPWSGSLNQPMEVTPCGSLQWVYRLMSAFQSDPNIIWWFQTYFFPNVFTIDWLVDLRNFFRGVVISTNKIYCLRLPTSSSPVLFVKVPTSPGPQPTSGNSSRESHAHRSTTTTIDLCVCSRMVTGNDGWLTAARWLIT